MQGSARPHIRKDGNVSLRNTSYVGTRFHTLYVGLKSCSPDTYQPSP